MNENPENKQVETPKAKKYKKIDKTMLAEVKNDFILKGLTRSEILAKYPISESSLHNYTTKYKWNQKRKDFLAEVDSKSKEIAIMDIAKWRAQEFVDSQKMRDKVNRAWEVSNDEDVDSLLKLSQTRLKVHDLGKSALGVADKVDVTSNGESLHQTIMQTIVNVEKIIASGFDVNTIDVEALAKEPVERD